MKDTNYPKGVRFVKGYFWFMGTAIAVLSAWILWSHTDSFPFDRNPYFQDSHSKIRPLWVLNTSLLACIHFICAANFLKGKRWVWITSLALCILTIGSITFPLIVACIVILLKRNTRQFFGIIRQ